MNHTVYSISNFYLLLQKRECYIAYCSLHSVTQAISPHGSIKYFWFQFLILITRIPRDVKSTMKAQLGSVCRRTKRRDWDFEKCCYRMWTYTDLYICHVLTLNTPFKPQIIVNKHCNSLRMSFWAYQTFKQWLMVVSVFFHHHQRCELSLWWSKVSWTWYSLVLIRSQFFAFEVCGTLRKKLRNEAKINKTQGWTFLWMETCSTSCIFILTLVVTSPPSHIKFKFTTADLFPLFHIHVYIYYCWGKLRITLTSQLYSLSVKSTRPNCWHYCIHQGPALHIC